MDFVHAENEGITMQTLYGIDTTAGRVNGCVGLRNVYFVVDSAVERISAQKYPVTLRSATSDGLTLAQIDFKKELKKVIQGAENGQGLELTGGDIWTGDDLPKFQFVSLAPQFTNGKVHDGLTVYCKWGRNIPAVCKEETIKVIEQDTGCEIEIAPVYHLPDIYSGVLEFSFSGTLTRVEKAKDLVWAECLLLGWASCTDEADVGTIWVQVDRMTCQVAEPEEVSEN